MTPMSSFIVAGTLSRPGGMTSLKKLTKTEVETKMETRKETFSQDCSGTTKTRVFPGTNHSCKTAIRTRTV